MAAEVGTQAWYGEKHEQDSFEGKRLITRGVALATRFGHLFEKDGSCKCGLTVEQANKGEFGRCAVTYPEVFSSR